MRARLAVVAALTLLAGGVLVGLWPQAPPPKPPHVFVLLVDTLRLDRVGWYGGGRGLTPFLDRLAERGGVFRRAYAPAPWTSPTIASLFTSRHQSQHGIIHFASVLEPAERTLAEELQAAGYATAGFSANLLVNAGLGYAQGFDAYEIYFTTRVKERAARVHADALAWIAASLRRRPDAPLFVYLHYMEPHEPLQPPLPALRALAAARGRSPETVAGLERLAGDDAPPLEAMDAATLALAEDLYDAEVASLDQELGAFFAELERRGLLQQSLVVVTADHGEEFLDHGAIGHGHTLYEELIHVPLLVVLPDQHRRTDLDQVVSLLDVAPTILDAAGRAAPPAFEGRSRLDPLRRPPILRWLLAPFERFAATGAAFSENAAFGEKPSRPKRHARAIVEADAKLILHRDAETEAYDLAADPGETDPAGLDEEARRALRTRIDDQQRGLQRAAAPRRTGSIDESTRERMRALGYTDDSP